MHKQHFHRGNRDANEGEFREYLRLVHIEFFLCPPGFGCDIIPITPKLYLFEIKNPKHAWKLEPGEEAQQAYCEELGIPYVVFERVEEMQAFVEKEILHVE